MKLLISLLSLFVFSGSKTLRNDLPGKWVYQYSNADNLKIQLDVDDELLGNVLAFSTCNDGKALNNMPPVVVNNRKADTIFNNIACTAYNKKQQKIDIYYPVCHSKDTKDIVFDITLYGDKYKQGASFVHHGDTLIIHTGKIHTVDGKNYNSVGHVYVKSK